MKGGLSSGGSTAGLTAFVLAAMLEAGVARTDDAVQDALRCIDAQTDVDDVYTLALMSYAFTLYDRDGSRRRDVMQKLNQRAVESGEWVLQESAVIGMKLTHVGKRGQDCNSVCSSDAIFKSRSNASQGSVSVGETIHPFAHVMGFVFQTDCVTGRTPPRHHRPLATAGCSSRPTTRRRRLTWR